MTFVSRAPERRNSRDARRAPRLARFVAALAAAAAACDYRCCWHSLDIGHVAFASRKVPE